MNNNPFEVNNNKPEKIKKSKAKKTKNISQKRITAEESTKVLKDNVLKGSITMLAIVFGSAVLYPRPSTSNFDDQLGDLSDLRLSDSEFYQQYNIGPSTETWQWNPDDFVDYRSEDLDYYDFMLYDNFEGKDNVIKLTTEEEELLLDLSSITPGIYTIENTCDLGYVYIGFNDYDHYLTVYNNQPIYNIPVMEDTVIELKNLDYGESNNVEFTFTKQDDYVSHDQEHMQGMFITGKSMFDNTEYDGEHQTAYYPKQGENRLDMVLFEEEPVYNVPGSVFFSHTY